MRASVPFLACLVACGGGGSAGESGAPTGSTSGPRACEADVFLTHGEGGCLGTDDAFDFKADLAGCATTGVLTIWRTDGTPWDEQHPLVLSSEGADGVWQAWVGGSLAHQAGTDAWVPGVSTAFDCQADAGKLTFAVRMFDASGALRDCGAWGHDPDRVIAGGASAVNADPPADFASCQVEAW